MRPKEYKFNPQTLAYEAVKAPLRVRIYRLVRALLIGFILVSLFNVVFSRFFYTPKMYRIEKQNRELLLQYGLLEGKIRSSMRKIEEIKHRDNAVYRTLFAADTLAIPGIYTDYPESKYASLATDPYAWLMSSTWHELDALGRLIYLESRSFDDLQPLAQGKGLMATAVPATWPMDRRLIRGRIGAFGMRNHPTLGIYHMHTGVDMGTGGRIGAPIYATGNGTVVADPGRGTGYGIQVIIDHGFGYRTRYAHLNKALVVPGQQVVRGEQIGELGNTGRSSGPHLHYEVIYRGTRVDPMSYLRRDMSEEDFEKILENATTTTYEYIDAPVHEER